MTFFSKLGENIILPQDVLIQSKETAGVSGAINATIGIATKNKKALFLPSIDKVIKDINNSEYLPYSPTPGLPEMRNLWKEKIISDNPKINKEHLSLPMVTTGITQGIDIAANLFSCENQFNENNTYYLENFKEVLYSIKESKISLILNFPNNPTGYTPSTEELDELTIIIDRFAKENPEKQVIIICDDAYFGLFFEENHKTPSLSSIYKLETNSNCLIVKLDGITKEYYGWGLRIGFITYYTGNDNLREHLLEKTQGYLRSTTSSPCNLSQQIAIRLLKDKDTYIEKKDNDKIIHERYIILKKSLDDYKLSDSVTVLPFNSGYFFTIKMPSKINAHDFRLKFLHDYKYGVYSMDNKHIRIAFSCLDKELIPDLVKNFKLCLNEFY